MSGEQRKFELSVPQILGGALASVTAAVAASYLGVAGTVVGAAVVSVASTVASAIYTHYLKRTGDRVKDRALSAWHPGAEEAQVGAPQAAPGEGLLAAAAQARPQESTLELPAVELRELETPPAPPGRSRLPWLKMAVAAALVFAVSMGSILVYQAVAHTTVHEQVTGKTPKTSHQRDAPPARKEREPQQPASTYGSQAPSERPSESPSPSDPTPSPSATPSPTATPTAEPTPTRSPQVEPSPEPSDPAPAQSQEQGTPGDGGGDPAAPPASPGEGAEQAPTP
ncbi:hypothetical protein AB0L05_37250 [Nonomuraea pusilla]|uniref:hypothetical protein n=1 Tax=Nonomuraea pusilla TaxID=46177 RepID=UPI00332A7AFF